MANVSHRAVATVELDLFGRALRMVNFVKMSVITSRTLFLRELVGKPVTVSTANSDDPSSASAVPMPLHCAGELKPPILNTHFPLSDLSM